MPNVDVVAIDPSDLLTNTVESLSVPTDAPSRITTPTSLTILGLGTWIRPEVPLYVLRMEIVMRPV